VRLTSEVDCDGRTLHQFQFELDRWRQSTLPIRLPSDVRCLAVRVDGHWTNHFDATTAVDGRTVIAVPMTDRLAGTAIEITYDHAAPSWRHWASVPASVPELPIPMPALRRVW